MVANSRIPIGKICSKCKGQLYSVQFHHHDGRNVSGEIICLACGEDRGLAQECDVSLNMIVTPPLDYLRLYEKEYQTDLRKIPQKNLLWGYLVGQVLPVSPTSLQLDEYFLAVYTLLTPNPEFTPFIGDVKEFHWKLEDQEDIEAYGVSGKPIIKVSKHGVWKAVVDIGYAYFVLVTKGGFANPCYAFLKETYQTRLPFENLDRVILTHLIRTKEVFHPGNY